MTQGCAQRPLIIFGMPPAWIVWSAVIISGTFATQVLAQVRPDAGSTLQQPAPRVEPAETRPLLPRITPEPVAPSDSTLRVDVKRFNFSGNTQISSELLAAQLANLVNREVGINDLRAATERIRDYYRGMGFFLAQAYLPRQQITDGVVEVAILEGRLGALTVKKDPKVRIRDTFLQGILDAHVAKGSLLDERELERPLLIIDGLPTARAGAALVPGAQTGNADIEVEVRPTPHGWLERHTNGALSGVIDADNHGNRFTGEYRLGVTLQAASLTGYGDVLAARFQKANESRSDLTRLSWTTPVGYYGTIFGIGYTRFDYGLTKNFAPLLADGDGQTANVYLSHPLLRTRPINLHVRAGYERKWLEDRAAATGFVDKRTVRNVFAGMNMDSRDSWGLSAANITHTRGNISLDTPAILTANVGVGGLGVNGAFYRTNFDAQRMQRIGAGFSLFGAVSGQFAGKNMSSSEKFSVGGPNAVRAFPVGEGAGDEGYLGSLELRYSHAVLKLGPAAMGLAAFYDHGHVRLNKDPANGGALLNNGRVIGGGGFGVNIGSEGNFLLRTSVAWRSSGGVPRSDPAQRTPRVWIQAMQWF